MGRAVHRHVITTRRVAPSRRGRLTALAVTLGLALVALAPTAATAVGQPQAPLTRWAVTPADESGQDDRASIQPALEAGESVTEHLAVQNLGEGEETFHLSAADGFTTRNGRFDMLASDQESSAAGTWIDIPDEVTVAAGESETVPFTITVPEQAEPGDHPAGVAASVISQQAADDGTSLGVESRVGIKVITRVKGELAPAISLNEVSTDHHGRWNPFRAGHVTATFEVTNTGNTRLSLAGRASAGTGKATFGSQAEPSGDLLPGDTREMTVTIDGAWPTFYLPGELVITPEAAGLDGSAPTVEETRASLGVWAVPWPQLLVLLALALLVVALIGNRRSRRRRLEALLEQAREEGRRSADPAASTQPPLSRRVRSPRGAIALIVVGGAVLAFLAPTAAVAADPEDGTDGVGVHVTITERDESTPAPTQGPDGESPDGENPGDSTPAPTEGPDGERPDRENPGGEKDRKSV